MQLYVLLAGKSKKRMKPIMIDEKHKCENYRDAREASPGSTRWHKIELAPAGSVKWRQKTSTIRGSGDKTNSGPSVVGKGPSGYIGKNGFNYNT